MSDASRVIVYGASGYTGKLIAESLHNRGIPFTAAGRSEERLRSAMQIVAERAGVESIDCEYREVEHNKDALAELLKGARVVANVVGPFIHLGEAVVQAALGFSRFLLIGFKRPNSLVLTRGGLARFLGRGNER